MFYNIDILEKYGYSEDDVPTTWDDFKRISDDITARGNGEDWGGAIPSFPHLGGSLRATPFLRQLGVDWGTADSVDMMSDPKVLETLEFIRAMNANVPLGLANANEEAPLWNAWDTEGQGNIAFIIDGTFRGQSNEMTGINAGVASLPLPEGGVEANCAVGAVLIGVPKDLAEQEAAFNVIRAIIEPEVAVGWINNYRVVPSRAAMDDDALFEGKGDTLLAARELYRTDSNNNPGLVVFSKNSNSIWEIINQKVLSATTMTDTPIADIVSEAQAEIGNLLK